MNQYFGRKAFFFVSTSSEDLAEVLGSQVWENIFVHYCNKCVWRLRMAGEKFV